MIRRVFVVRADIYSTARGLRHFCMLTIFHHYADKKTSPEKQNTCRRN